MKSISLRTSVVLVTFVTLALLIGSAVLQRIVFRADQHFSSLTLSPNTFQAAVGQTVDITVRSEAVEPILLSGFQVELNVDDSKLKFQEAVPPAGWQTIVAEAKGPVFRWIAVPAPDQPILTTVQGSSVLGTLRFTATGDGVTSAAFIPTSTFLSAVDPVAGNFVYNAAESFQSAVGTIAGEGSAPAFPETNVSPIIPAESTAPKFGAQRVLSSYATPLSQDALLFVTLAYSGKLSVEFGPTQALGNKVEVTRASTHHVVTLAGLEPLTRYYYRIVGLDPTAQSHFTTAPKSFVTTGTGTGEVAAAKSEAIIFPSKTNSSTTMYIFPRDEAGNALGEAAPNLDDQEGLRIGEVRKAPGYYQATLSTQSPKKQISRLAPRIGSVILPAATVVFDPNYQEPTSLRPTKELILAWNHKSMATVFGGVIVLFLLILLFTRLARSR